MKKKILLTSRLQALAMAMLMALPTVAENVAISTPRNTLVVDIEKGVEPKFVYYGQRLSETDLATLPAPTTANWSITDIYPAYGANRIQDEVCLAMRHADGNLSTQLVSQGYELSDVTDKAPNGQPRKARLLTIRLSDTVYPTTVTLNYLAYTDVDIIESWAEITNGEKKTVTLTQFLSSMMPIRRNNVWVSHMHGSWAAEAQLSQHKLENGQLRIKNKDGLRNATSDRQELMFSLEGRPQENQGDVIGAALMYSGNYAVNVDTREGEYHYFSAGINPDNSEYHLDRGKTLKTPHVAYTFSAEGLSGASRAYHRWARRYQLRHGADERMILLNSWEGVYFDINQKGMDQMMHDIKSMGGELFVMDDGWFGDKYRRLTDNSSLGDWVVDRKKLPNGISWLVRQADYHGIRFGIWIEPEMTNTESELYEKHPDWVLKAPKRDVVTGRGGTQLVLDLTNPEVRDFIVGMVDDLMRENPEIDYIKWDANMSIDNHGSQYLAPDRQSHLYIEYHRGFADVCKRIRAKYPELTIQACASGGGRANYGIMPWFDEFWVSDNTDALQRIYMQWGISYFYPAITMASHISATPNHTVFRTTSLKYRIDVAMSGRLGMEIQPKNMTTEEKDLCRKAIAEYKEIRPVVQFGDLYRLVSPYDGKNIASLMYCSPEKDKAVFYWWKLETFYNEHLPRVRMQGLDPDKSYRIHELNRIDNEALPYEDKVFTGKYLMENGLEMPLKHKVDYHKQNDWSSRVLYLTAE